jgi:hypothetical protein
VLSTADLACSRSGNASTRLGGFLFFRDFDIGDGLLNRRLDDVVKIAPAAFMAGNCRGCVLPKHPRLKRCGRLKALQVFAGHF